MNGPTLIAMPVLSIEAVPACAVLHLSDYDREVPLNGYAWLYRSNDSDGWTLIDTGMSDPSAANVGRIPKRQWQAYSLTEAMARHGVSPEEVHGVILTHLHIDHCGSLEEFPNASWCVPKLEWQFAGDPANADLAREPLFCRKVLKQMHEHGVKLLVDGDCPAPGLRVRHIGGHTPGSIALEVLDGVGDVRLALAGDVAPLYDNLTRMIPPGTLWHWGECRRALARWAAVKYPVLPNHDVRLLKTYPNGIVLNGRSADQDERQQLGEEGLWAPAIEQCVSGV